MALFPFSFLKRDVSKEDILYKDDYDGKFKYVKKLSFLPHVVRKIIGLPELKRDRRKRRFGRIRANPFYYLTIPMFFTLFLVVYAVGSGFMLLVEYFNTNIYLNGLIISLMIFGILRTFYNSYMLYGTAVFIRKIEKVTSKDKIELEDIYMLRRSLEKQGELVNTIYMSQTIDNIEQFGHPNFNGMRARLIKSKLGFRTSKQRSNVNFIAGILVMLGLLGTFLGLLGTIDAVGEALNSMSNMGGDGGEVGMEQMSNFIGSLAAPLQGMGLAFSSSLFGLSGSLLIGFFLHLSGTPQNEFIENFSRWIDDREMRFDPNVAKGSKAKISPKDDDLKEWMSGFIHMSVRTNKAISMLSESVSEATKETTRAWSEVRGLSEAQQALNNSIQEIGGNIQSLQEQGGVVARFVPQIVESLQSSQSVIVDRIDGIKQDASNFSIHTQKTNKLLRHYIGIGKQDADSNKEMNLEIGGVINQLNMTLKKLSELERSHDSAESILDLKEALFNLDRKQTDVLVEIKSLLERLQQDPQIEQAQTLVVQLNDLLNKLNKKTRNLFSRK